MPHELDRILIFCSDADFDKKMRKLRSKMVTAARFAGYGSEENQQVVDILSAVTEHGDKAVAQYTEKFDGVKLKPGQFRITKEELEIGTIDLKGEIFGEMRIIDSLSRSASVYAIGKTMCLAVDTSAKRRMSAGSTQDEKLDFLLLLYRIFAEFMSIRLRATNEELIAAKKKVRRLIEKI